MPSPYRFAMLSEASARLLRRHVYVAEVDRFYDLERKTYLTRPALDAMHAHQFEKSPSGQFLRSSIAAKIQRLVYLPGEPRGFIDEAVNTWQPSDLEPRPGPHSRIDALFELLFPVPSERAHVLDYLAFLAKNPGRKIAHALILCGLQGCGKSTVLTIGYRIVGPTNCKAASGSQLLNRFTLDLMNIQFLGIEEVAWGDRSDVANNIKTMVTQRTVRAEEKGLPFSEVRTPDAIILVSNDAQPIVIEKGDRRYFSPRYIDKVAPQAFYDDLYRYIDVELPGFLASLLRRDLSLFNPDSAPPMTQAKAEMIRDSAPAAEAILRDMIEDRQGCMARDILVPAHAVAALRIAGVPSVSPGYLRAMLRRLGARACAYPLPPPPRGSSAAWKVESRVWAIRNQDRWVNASKAELKAHMLGQDGQS